MVKRPSLLVFWFLYFSKRFWYREFKLVQSLSGPPDHFESNDRGEGPED